MDTKVVKKFLSEKIHKELVENTFNVDCYGLDVILGDADYWTVHLSELTFDYKTDKPIKGSIDEALLKKLITDRFNEEFSIDKTSQNIDLLVKEIVKEHQNNIKEIEKSEQEERRMKASDIERKRNKKALEKTLTPEQKEQLEAIFDIDFNDDNVQRRHY